MTILAALQKKTKCLEQLLSVSDAFLDSPLEADTLSQFEIVRAGIFKAIELYQHRIEEITKTLDRHMIDTATAALIENELHRQNSILSKIQSVDSRIMNKLQKEMESTKIELTNSKKTRKSLSKFKSGSRPEGGEKLNKVL